MNCRQFRSRHVAFVDDLLSASDMRAMRAHTLECARCSRLDVQIRRSLMVIRSLPSVEPSPEFLTRLNARLRDIDASPLPERTRTIWERPAAAVAAGIALVAALTYGFATYQSPQQAASIAQSSPDAALAETLIADAAAVAAVPTGVPVWSAVLALGQLPTQFVDAGFIDDVHR